MKRKKLYTRLTSKPKLIHENNVFDDGGYIPSSSDLRWDRLASSEYGANYGNKDFTLSDYKSSTGNNWFDISKQNNPFSKGNIGDTLGVAAGAIATPVGDLLGNAISGGYSSGAGSAISNIGSTVGTGLMKVNPFLGAGVTVGSKVFGGITNALFGMKTNKKALSDDNNSINYFKGFNSNANSFDDMPTLIASTNFMNPYKGGVFTKGKARRKNNALRDQYNEAKSFAQRSVDNNILNIADNNMNMALANYSAFGGPLDIMSNGGGAIDYGFMTDYLNMKNNQAQAKNNTVGYLGNIPNEPMAFADGGGIHIAKSKEGTYKAAADRRGISMSELADRIKANPENYSPALRKKANFYNNFARHKKSDGGNLLIGNNGDTLFALGGDMQTNGGDFGSELSHIDAGGTHEQNPNEGVQYGIAPDNSPNLVEEGETVFKDEDYVFSNRIHPKKEVLKKFHMYSKGGKLTYADISKRLEKEAKERPNDPISKASLKDMLTQLMEAQEQQKAEEEAKEAKKAFEALSPEEQKAVLEQIAQQHQIQANAEQQVNPQEEQEVPVDENGNPIEQTEEIPNQEDIAQNDEGSISAYGGKINKFPDGGRMIKQAILNAIKMKNGQRVLTKQMFDDWAKENNVTGFDYDGDWTKALQNESLKAAITKASPELAYAMANGYGTPYDVDNSPILNTDQTKGNWVEYMPQAWKSSADAFMKELQWDTIKDMSNKEFADAVRNTNAYKKTTEWLKNADNAKQYFNALLKDNNTPEDAKNWINSNILDSNGNWIGGKYNYDTMLKPVREDNYVGSFWKSAVPATIPDINKSLLVGKDGSISIIDNDDLTGLTKVGNPYKWTDANGNNTYTFYSMPETDATDNSKKDNNDEYEAKHRPEWLRYAGLLGPAVGLGLWGAGVGKPDTKGLDAAMEYASQANGKADYMPIGDYLRYNPMDIWAQENRNDANARATDRAIVNNNTTAGSKMAGLLANGYNSQIADANLFRQAQEYNDAQRQKVAEFNRGTNMFNADAYNKTSQTNAELQNRNAQFRANLAAQIASQKMNADSQWYNALYGNIGSLFQGIGDLGRENAQHNMIANMAANSLFGTMTDKTPIARTFLRKKDKSAKAKGGKLKRRKGLTF